MTLLGEEEMKGNRGFGGATEREDREILCGY